MSYDIYELNRENYPDTLKVAEKPPKKLFVRGTLPSNTDQKYLCVVGSRKWSKYGRDVLHKLMNEIRGYPISIVSGLAIGIDGLAHEAALNAGLHCIAFPGSNLEWNAIYPSCNEGLARRIIGAGGALMSIWPSGKSTGDWAFPVRNQLMAIMSHATLIIEADHGSGSLMTAEHALDNDRLVMAVPGSIFSTQSYGPHMLINEGAPPITSGDDILRVLGFPINKMTKIDTLIRTLDEHKASIIDIVKSAEITVDELAARVKMPVAELMTHLSFLEMMGHINVSDERVRIL